MARTRVFNAAHHEAHQWLAAMGRALGTADERSALAALRATLHVVRDSLATVQTVEVGDRLPVLIRGLYYEDWSPWASRSLAAKALIERARGYVHGCDDLPPIDQTLLRCVDVLTRLLPKDAGRTVLSALPAALKEMRQKSLKAGATQRLQDWRWG